jgi:mono/diheme cytochrome c family protein
VRLTASLLALAMTAALPMLVTAADPAPATASSLPRDSGDAAVVRGGIVYRTYCVLCHGAAGKGDGRAAKMYTPKPANLTVSPFNDAYKEMIIRGGGASVGRSSYMPPWGDELTDEQVRDLIAFLRELRKTGTPQG